MPDSLTGNPVFKYLPAFAQFILDNQLDNYLNETLQQSREVNMPLLKYFEHLSAEKLLGMNRQSALELLQGLSQNNLKNVIDQSVKRWKENLLPIIQKDNVVVEDITLVGYVRKKVFLAMIPSFTHDPALIIELVKEIDTYVLAYTTVCYKVFIGLLEERILEHSHFIETITHTLPGIIYVFDREKNKEVYTNLKVHPLLGYTKEDFENMDGTIIAHLLKSEDKSKVQQYILNAGALRDGEIQSIEYRMKTKQGAYRWQRNYESVFKRNDQGQVCQTIGIVLDIEEEKLITEKLRKQELQLLDAQQIAEIGTFEWDLTTLEGEETPHVLSILDLKESDRPHEFFSKIHPHDKPYVKASLEKSIQQKSIFDCEFRYLTSHKEIVVWKRGTIFLRDEKPWIRGTVMDVTQKHRIIQKLQKSEALYKQAQAITHIGNYVWDVATHTLTWSDELYHIYNLTPGVDNIVYEDISRYNHREDDLLVKEAIKNSLETLQPFDFYYRIILPDGIEKTLHARGEIIADEKGSVHKIIGTGQDVTERQNLIKNLQRSEVLHKQAQSIAKIGNWRWDVVKNEVYWTDQLYDIFGLPPTTKINFEGFLEMIHPDDRQMVQELINSCFNTHEGIEFYHRIIFKDNSVKIIHGKCEVHVNKQNEVIEMVGTGQDVTKQRLLQEELRQNEKFIQKIANATPSIISSYNVTTGQYVFVNKALKKILGYEVEYLLQKGLDFMKEVVHPDDLAPLLEKNQEAIKKANEILPDQDEPIVEFQYRMRHKNGEYRWFHTFDTVLDRNGEGKIIHLLNISLDITARVKAEEILKHRTYELQQSNARLEEFAFVASHDLKEPLRKISIFTDRLRSMGNDNQDDAFEYLEKIGRSSHRMQQMINDLLSLSQLSGDKSFVTSNLQHLLNDVLQRLEHKVDELQAIILSKDLPEVRVVPSQISQLFQNLINNSLKFARKEERLVIKIGHKFLEPYEVVNYNVGAAKRYLKIVFEDNGIGFDNAFCEKIFSIFQRLHSRDVYEGTGIGLSICKKIVENHQGVILAKGEVNKGAAFTIVLPV